VPSFWCRTSEEHISDLLNEKTFTLNSDPDVFNRIEKQTGKDFFSTIDWRNMPFDIRMIWEPARLQNITTLVAYANANPINSISDKIEQYCLDQIFEWIKKKPVSLRATLYLGNGVCTQDSGFFLQFNVFSRIKISSNQIIT
jgi:hypothetical protein